MVDMVRLVKLLNMTESQHDGEALTAIRRSNALLRQSKTSWEELLAPLSTPQQVSPPHPKPEQPIAPERKTTDWGSDLFGDEPTFTNGSTEKDAKDDAKVFARFKIRSVPLVWRLFFFPIWAAAETYVATVYREPLATRLIAIAMPLMVGGFAAVMWFAIATTVAKALSR